MHTLILFSESLVSYSNRPWTHAINDHRLGGQYISRSYDPDYDVIKKNTMCKCANYQ